MALIACAECGNQVSTQAGACPHCGAPQRAAASAPAAGAPAPTKAKGTAWVWVLAVPVGLFAMFAIMGSNDPRIQGMQRDRKPLELCMADMRDALRSASFREAARGMCERMRDDFVRKYGQEP